MKSVQNLKRHNQSYQLVLIDENQSTFDFVVSEDLIVKYRLLKGKIIDETTFRAFKSDVAMDALMQKAKTNVVRYSKSVSQTKAYLESKTDDYKAIFHILDELKKLNLLNDERLIEQLIDTAVTIKKEGPLKIKMTLKSMGFQEDDFMERLLEISESHLNENLTYLFDKQLLSYQSKPALKATILMKQYLHQKGYSISDVDRFVNQQSNRFSTTDDEIKHIKEDALRIQKKLDKQDLSTTEYRQKLTQSLLSKGYRYAVVKTYLEGR